MTNTTSQPNQAATTSQSVMRIVNGIALGLIGLSVLAQCLRHILMYIEPGNNGLTPGGLLGLISFSIVPGMVLAFAKLILNVIRSPRNTRARPKAAMYFLVVMVPFVLPLILMKAPDRSAATTVAMQQAEPEQSEQFMTGREWATVNNPIHDTQCKGSSEFNRGCRMQIELRRKAQREQGYEWARQNLPVKATLCQGTPYFVLGCRTYFVEHLRKPKPAHLGKYEGMTTAECIEEVNGNFEARKALNLEEENFVAIEVHYRKHWEPELRDCENYDKHIELTFMPQAYGRLEKAIDRIKKGNIPTDDEQASLFKDFTEMSKIREQPYTVAYMKLFDQYSKLPNGDPREHAIAYLQISCGEYQAKLNEMSQQVKERTNALLALQRSDGMIIESAEQQRLDRQRTEIMSDWTLYTDGAKKAGCNIATN